MSASGWIQEEFERSQARRALLPDYAKPVVTTLRTVTRADQIRALRKAST